MPRRAGALAFGALTLAYPFLVYVGIERVEPRRLALILVTLGLLRALATRESVWLWAAASALILGGLSVAANALLPLKLYPVVVNVVLLAVFALSLARPPSVIERLARLREPQLSSAGVAYTRRVTEVWCVFFVVNGSIALFTALWASDRAWALYNGFIAYLLMGALFLGEWLVRHRVRKGES